MEAVDCFPDQSLDKWIEVIFLSYLLAQALQRDTKTEMFSSTPAEVYD